MDKIITTIILLLVCSDTFSQDSLAQCKCRAYFGDKEMKKDTINKDFYSKYDKIITKLNEECNDIKILKDSADYFYIQPFYDLKKHTTEKYWLKKNSQFFVNPLSDESNNFVLYSDHDSKSKKIFTHSYGYEKTQINQTNVRLKVLGCFNDWLKVSLTYKGKEYIGWTKRYCPLSCTTCT